MKFSLHPLVVGGAVVEEDVRLEPLTYFEPSSSGVCCESIFSGVLISIAVQILE